MNETAHAKINICLDVLGRRPDGYHELRMIMQELELHDDIEIYEAEEGKIQLTIESLRSASYDNMQDDLQEIPTDMRNLMCKAADKMIQHFQLKKGVSMKLTKRIPAAAGLGGGSADAAAVIRGMNRLFQLKASDAELVEIGKSIGADVPYCIFGGTYIAEGIGEKLRPIENRIHVPVLLVKPKEGASTKAVYTAFDSIPEEKVQHPDIDGAEQLLADGAVTALCEKMGNVLEPVTGAMLPDIGLIERYMEAHGAIRAMMSGSGPTVFGFFPDEATMSRCAKGFTGMYGAAAFSDIIETGF